MNRRSGRPTAGTATGRPFELGLSGAQRRSTLRIALGDERVAEVVDDRAYRSQLSPTSSGDVIVGGNVQLLLDEPTSVDDVWPGWECRCDVYIGGLNRIRADALREVDVSVDLVEGRVASIVPGPPERDVTTERVGDFASPIDGSSCDED